MTTPDIKTFIKYLKSDNEDTRVRAVMAVAASGYSEAPRILKTVANHDSSSRVRFEANRLWDQLEREARAEQLNESLEQLPDELNSLKVSSFMDPKAFQAEMKKAAEGSGYIDSSDTTPTVDESLAAIRVPPPPKTSSTARNTPSGSRSGSTNGTARNSAAGGNGTEPDIMALSAHFKSANPGEQIKILQSMENTVAAYRDFMGKACELTLDDEVRATLVKSYGTIGNTDAIQLIAKFLTDTNRRVKANAIEGLEHIGHPKAFPYIAHFLRDKDNRIRGNVVKALQKFGKRNLEGMLDDMLLSEEKWMRSSAAYCLAIMATEEHMHLLKRGMDDPERSVRSKIRTALQRLAREGSERARELLCGFSEQTSMFPVEENASFNVLTDGTLDIEQLFHEEARFRAAEVDRIGKKNDEKYLSVLYDCLEQESTDIVAKKILHIICHFKPLDSINKIAGKLNSKNPDIVKLAVNAIMEIDSETGASLVAGTLNHSNEEVAANTFLALRTASTEFAFSQLQMLLKSRRSDQRTKALTFLNLVSDGDKPEGFEDFLLECFKSDPDITVIPAMAEAYSNCVTQSSLSDYFTLKKRYANKVESSVMNSSNITDISFVKLKALEKIRPKIARKLNLSPEDLGYMEEEAVKSVSKESKQIQASHDEIRQSQITAQKNVQAKERHRSILRVALPLFLLFIVSGGLTFSKPYWSKWMGSTFSSQRKRPKAQPEAVKKDSILGPVGNQVDIRCTVKGIRERSNRIIFREKEKRLLLSVDFTDIEVDYKRFKADDEVRLKGIIQGIGNNERAIILKGTLLRKLI